METPMKHPALLVLAVLLPASLLLGGCEREPGDGASGVSPPDDTHRADQVPPAAPQRP